MADEKERIDEMQATMKAAALEEMKAELEANGYKEDAELHWHWRGGNNGAYSATFPSIDSAYRHYEEGQSLAELELKLSLYNAEILRLTDGIDRMSQIVEKYKLGGVGDRITVVLMDAFEVSMAKQAELERENAAMKAKQKEERAFSDRLQEVAREQQKKLEAYEAFIERVAEYEEIEPENGVEETLKAWRAFNLARTWRDIAKALLGRE